MVKKNVSLVHIHNKLLKFRKIKCNELCGIQRFSCKCPCSQFILIYKEKEIGMSDLIFLNGETFGDGIQGITCHVVFYLSSLRTSGSLFSDV